MDIAELTETDKTDVLRWLDSALATLESTYFAAVHPDDLLDRNGLDDVKLPLSVNLFLFVSSEIIRRRSTAIVEMTIPLKPPYPSREETMRPPQGMDEIELQIDLMPELFIYRDPPQRPGAAELAGEVSIDRAPMESSVLNIRLKGVMLSHVKVYRAWDDESFRYLLLSAGAHEDRDLAPFTVPPQAL